MSLVTRCSSCATAFRVLPGQLSARNGRVRCGKCGTVFDGIAGLVAKGAEASRGEPSPQLGLFDPSRREPPRVDRVVSDDEDEPLPAFMAEPHAPHRLLWGSLVALAIVVLLAQAAYHYRAEIAAGLPASRELFQAACRVLDCDLRLPRQVRLLSIDSYEVRADPGREGFIVLSAVIRNRAPFPQEFPALLLTLTDEANRQLASRKLTPREYLGSAGAAQLMARGIEAGGEASLTVYFDASRARATGYELVLFYPS